MNNNSIGVLDSGIGGLTVAREIINQLPYESVVYIGDSVNSPYGTREASEVCALSKRMVDFLLSKKVKLVVVACNTITVSCIAALRKDYPQIPIIGTVPVVKKAAELTRAKRIGILSTTSTARSQYQGELIREFCPGCIVINQGTDELVPMIEKGEIEGAEIKKVLEKVMGVFKKEKIDTLALGCTHFPFLRAQIELILGPEVQVLDSGLAIARQVKRVLEKNNALADTQNAKYSFYLTGPVQKAAKSIEIFFDSKFPRGLKKISI